MSCCSRHNNVHNICSSSMMCTTTCRLWHDGHNTLTLSVWHQGLMRWHLSCMSSLYSRQGEIGALRGSKWYVLDYAKIQVLNFVMIIFFLERKALSQVEVDFFFLGIFEIKIHYTSSSIGDVSSKTSKMA